MSSFNLIYFLIYKQFNSLYTGINYIIITFFFQVFQQPDKAPISVPILKYFSIQFEILTSQKAPITRVYSKFSTVKLIHTTISLPLSFISSFTTSLPPQQPHPSILNTHPPFLLQIQHASLFYPLFLALALLTHPTSSPILQIQIVVLNTSQPYAPSLPFFLKHSYIQ